MTFRLRSRGGGGSTPSAVAAGDLPLAAPPVQWDGTEGSGFTALANEPTPNFRSTTLALPVAFEMQEQLLAIPTNRTMGFWVGMNPSAGIVTGVYWDIEGREIQAGEMGLVTRQSVHDETITEAYYAFELDVASFAHQGTFRSYLRVTHTGTAPDLIYGPLVHNHFATEYDSLIEIAPSQTETTTRKQTMKAAHDAAVALGSVRPEMRFIESGSYAIGSLGNAYRSPIKFWRTYTTAPGVSVTLANATLTEWRPKANNLRFVGDFTIDPNNNVDGWYCEDGFAPWMLSMSGVKWQNSVGEGGNALRDGGTQPGLMREPASNVTTEYFAYMRDVTFDNISFGLRYARGWNIEVENLPGDAVPSWQFIYGAKVKNQDPRFLRTPISVMTLSSTVPMTISKTGDNGVDNPLGTFIIKVPGDPLSPYTLTFPKLPGTNYYPSSLVASINALGIAGLTCTGITAGGRQDERKCTMLTMVGISGFKGFADVSIQGAGVTLVTAIDIHNDIYQSSTNDMRTFVAYVNVQGANINQAQNTHVAGTGHSNLLFVNWEIQNAPGDNAMSHVGYGTELNLGYIHVTMPEQDFDLSAALTYNTAGFYGVASYKTFKDTATLTNSFGVGNFSKNQGATLPPNTALFGTISGFTEADFVDYAGGDLTPATSGAFDANRIARVYPYDIDHKARPTMTTATAREIA